MAGAPALTGRTADALRWSALAAAAEALLALAILAVLARVLAPRDFGVTAIALAVIGLAGPVARLGIGPAIVQRRDLTCRHMATGFALAVSLGALLAVGLWLAAPAAGRLFVEPEVPAVLAALASVFVIAGLGEVPEHLLLRALRFRQLMVAGILSQAAGYGLVALALAFAGYGVWSLVGGIVARHALFSAAVLVMRPPPLGARPGRREAAELLRFGTGQTASALLGAAAGQGSRFLLGGGLGAASLGLYVQALRVADAPARLGAVLRRVLFPAMAARQHHPERLAPVYLHGIEAMWLAALPGGVLLAHCAPELVAVLFGAQWSAAAPALAVLAAGAPFHLCGVVNTPAIRALGAVYREAWRRAVHVALTVLGVWLGLEWGIAGAAAGFVAARIVLHLLLTQLARGLLGIDWGPLLRCHLPSLWTGAWSGAALLAATALAREAALPDIVTLAVGGLAWAAAAAAAICAAPGFARPRSLAWTLERLPFERLGTVGPALRFLLRRLDRTHARAARTEYRSMIRQGTARGRPGAGQARSGVRLRPRDGELR